MPNQLTLTELMKLDERPAPFSVYTAQTLWDDEHISARMLAYHLNEEAEPASRPAEVIRRSVGWIAKRFGIGPETRIADFGCGPGLYTTPFAERCAQVTGIDFSRRSISHAKRVAAGKGLTIDYELGNYLEFASDKRFDLITLIYCDFCALSPVQRRRLLALFLTHLADGGRLLLDVFSLEAFAAREEVANFGRNFMGGFWAPGEYLGFQRTFLYEKEKVALDKYTIVEPHRTRVIYNWLQYFSLEAITSELAECGFAVEEIFSDVTGAKFRDDAPEVVLVATRAD